MSAPVHFDGSCPFLFCLKTGPHDHPVCEKCGAVRYGNFRCDTCQVNRPAIDAEILADYRILREGNVHANE